MNKQVQSHNATRQHIQGIQNSSWNILKKKITRTSETSVIDY